MNKLSEAGLFRRIIEPLDPAAFVAEAWEQRSRMFPGEADRFRDLQVDLGSFMDALRELLPNSIRANHVRSDGTGRYFPVQAEDCSRLFEQGMTICVTNLQAGMPRLIDLARDTRRALGLAGRVNVNAYLSPASCGFGLHLDTQSVFIVQIEGEKHWLYGTEPAAVFPPEGTDAYPDDLRRSLRARYPHIPLAEPRTTEWRQRRLRPGDALYLPAGTWHQGTAGDHSLALTLTCGTHEVSTLLTPLLTGLFTGDEWRRNLPCALAAEGGPSRDEFLAERLAELRRWACALSTDDLGRVWDGLIAADAVPRR